MVVVAIQFELIHPHSNGQNTLSLNFDMVRKMEQPFEIKRPWVLVLQSPASANYKQRKWKGGNMFYVGLVCDDINNIDASFITTEAVFVVVVVVGSNLNIFSQIGKILSTLKDIISIHI